MQNSGIEIWLPFGAFVLAWLTTGWMSKRNRVNGLMDIPNERSSHSIPTPRGGGAGILVALAAGFGGLHQWRIELLDIPLWGALAMLAVVSWMDDKYNLPSIWRLVVQILAAVWIVSAHGPAGRFPLPPPLDFDLGWSGFPFSIIWILGVTNIFNFLDGIDGYAGVQCIIAGWGLFVFFNSPSAALAGLLIMGASAGFLAHNWSPAKIFMGDVGSAPLGFFFAAVPFYATDYPLEKNIFIMAMLLWFFLADGAFTICRRLSKGEKIWKPHRSHLYQRLTIAGWNHSKVVLFVLALQTTLFLVMIPWHFHHFIGAWHLILAAATLFLILFVTTTIIESKAGREFPDH